MNIQISSTTLTYEDKKAIYDEFVKLVREANISFEERHVEKKKELLCSWSTIYLPEYDFKVEIVNPCEYCFANGSLKAWPEAAAKNERRYCLPTSLEELIEYVPKLQS